VRFIYQWDRACSQKWKICLLEWFFPISVWEKYHKLQKKSCNRKTASGDHFLMSWWVYMPNIRSFEQHFQKRVRILEASFYWLVKKSKNQVFTNNSVKKAIFGIFGMPKLKV
jgi:hypothetical protein